MSISLIYYKDGAGQTAKFSLELQPPSVLAPIPGEGLYRWVKVEDSLPDYDAQVLWLRSDGNMFIDEILHDISWNSFKELHEISFAEQDFVKLTHWMKLPNLPNE